MQILRRFYSGGRFHVASRLEAGSSSRIRGAAGRINLGSTQLDPTHHDCDEGSYHRAWPVRRVYQPDVGILVADSWDTVANANAPCA